MRALTSVIGLFLGEHGSLLAGTGLGAGLSALGGYLRRARLRVNAPVCSGMI
jgi:hypothetical protein